MVFLNIWSVLQWYLRPFIKWFLRKTTRLCELQRICYGEKLGAARTLGVEKSLNLSRTREIQEVISYLDAVILKKKFVSNYDGVFDPAICIILKVKKINPKAHLTFSGSIGRCLEQIWSYKQLVSDVDEMRKTPYDSENDEHERKLLQLWSSLMEAPLESRITKQWQDIGFQGDDPKTDFRGMGILGLENLLYFSVNYPKVASHVLSHSFHPEYGYTFAVVGINITAMAYYIVKDGSAKSYMYNHKNISIDIKLFHKLYSYLFFEFDKLWMESKPESMMEFSKIYQIFDELVRNQLADPASVFRINLRVDTV